jgi:hypothetical protein
LFELALINQAASQKNLTGFHETPIVLSRERRSGEGDGKRANQFTRPSKGTCIILSLPARGYLSS